MSLYSLQSQDSFSSQDEREKNIDKAASTLAGSKCFKASWKKFMIFTLLSQKRVMTQDVLVTPRFKLVET